MRMKLEKVYQYIDVHANTFVEDLVKLVRQPSVSAKSEGIEECAVLVEKMLQEVGFSTKTLREEKVHPVVYGELKSQVRVIRTIGGMGENRSLVVGIHLAGFKEIAVIMHTDCGCSLAYHKVDKIIENMEANLGAKKLEDVKNIIGEPFRENLLEWLHAFHDPREAVKKEVKTVKESPFVPKTLILLCSFNVIT